MGNCVSCTEPSSHEQPDRWMTDADKKITELQTPGSLGAGGSGGMSGRNDGGGGGSGRDAFGNGSCTPAGSTSHNHHVLSPLDSHVSSGQKAEKKTFYSRIPPLGRSGSDKKASIISNSNSSAIKDNNNAYSESKIASVFEQYKDSHEDLILAEGIEKLCKDLEVKPEDFKVLVLAWKFGAEQMCRFTREEFYRGMKELKTDNVKGIQARLPDCVTEVLSDPTMFKDLYRFAFRFGLDNELGQRILPVEMATSLWRVVFSQREPPLLDRWVGFLDAHPLIRGVPKDTWNMFLNFVETVDTDLSSYDDTEAWPSLFDDFVEYENDRLNQNLTTTMTSSSSSSEKADHQRRQELMTIEENYPSIPPPAEFRSEETNSNAGVCVSSSKSNSVKVLPVTSSSSSSSYNHPHQLMSIETSSTSGYTKIIHSNTSGIVQYSSPPPVSASSYNAAGIISNTSSSTTTPAKLTQQSPTTDSSSSSIGGGGGATASSYPFGYNHQLSDV